MATTDAPTRARPVAIAPAPPGSNASLGATADSPQHVMSYTCQTCAKRKVKCDKVTPICSSCRKGKLECFYQAPRRRKRKLSGDVNERVTRNEPFEHQHLLQPQDSDASPSIENGPHEITFFEYEPQGSAKGKLLAGPGKSRYIDSNLWHNLGEGEMQPMLDDEEEDQPATGIAGCFASDPLTGAIMGHRQNLIHYHPSHKDAMLLWKTHVKRVEPLCKVLHIPSTLQMLEVVSQQPATASKADECLLFAIYHFAVFSMTDEECIEKFAYPRATLMQRYHLATRQALVNATFLKTTEMSILQSLVLFLLPCRYFYDPHTYWILTGVAVRIAQRMGLHRDGEKLGLPPFEVQMRRRLFYQLLPLDAIAGQMSGTGIGIIPDTWDIQQPLNINDDQIYPGMTDDPKEQKGATEMIFCLARICIGKFFASSGKSLFGTTTLQLKTHEEAEQLISAAESEVEENYIRYCDIVNPLHFLTMASARSGINTMRIRILTTKVRNRTVTDAEKKERFQLAQKIIDTDTAVYAHTSLRTRYLWHVQPFFLWGTWDALILILTSLWSSDLLSSTEADATWSKVEQVYDNHGELLRSKRALYVAFGRLTLKAWDANPPKRSVPEPTFITALRSRRNAKLKGRQDREDVSVATQDAKPNIVQPNGPSLASDADAFFASLSEGTGFDLDSDFNLDIDDWMFWDQLIQNDQAQGSLE